MSETTPLSAEERYPIEIIQGVEGFCIGLNNYRIAGPKPWGGGTVVKRWDVSLADLGRAIPSIDAQATEIAALRGALEREKRSERREGLVAVIDHEGNYLGCMGTMTWAVLAVEEVRD